MKMALVKGRGNTLEVDIYSLINNILGINYNTREFFCQEFCGELSHSYRNITVYLTSLARNVNSHLVFAKSFNLILCRFIVRKTLI